MTVPKVVTPADKRRELAQQLRGDDTQIDVILDINGERWEFKNASGSVWELRYDGNGSPYLLVDGERIVIGKYSGDNL
ncbi:MAG: hypothetical protein WCE53_13675 [Candidatus Acidiferrum sp.]